MTRQTSIKVGVLAATAVAAIALVKPAVAGDQLTITSGGGSLEQVLRKVFFEPFVKTTGIKITEDEYDYGLAKIRAMVASESVSWNVVYTSESGVRQLCAEGIIETIDWKKLSLDRAKFEGANYTDCGVPANVSATVVAYDKARLPNGPTTIADLFDLQKIPGKRGLYKSPASNLEWALIADGVLTKDVYKILRTPEGVDRAFKELDSIKKDIVWWTAGAQPPQLLADGQVIMATAYNTRITDPVKNSGQHFEILWGAAQLNGNAWVILKGTTRVEEAYKFRAFAGSPQVQAEIADSTAAGPINKDAIALIAPANLPNIPNAPEHMGNALVQDVAFWIENGDELRQRFTCLPSEERGGRRKLPFS